MLDGAAGLLKPRNDIIPGPLHHNSRVSCFSISPFTTYPTSTRNQQTRFRICAPPTAASSALTMASVNCKHDDNAQTESALSKQGFVSEEDKLLTQVNRRFELFVLQDGEKKIEEKVVSGASITTILKQQPETDSKPP
jgi:hypothetical protein